MVIFLDMEKQTIVLYTEKGIVRIPFVDANSLHDYLDGKNALYITNAVEAGAGDIVGLLKGMGIAVAEDNFQDTGYQYLHGTTEGTIYIDPSLKFEGPWDCKLIDENMAHTMQNHPVVRDLIRNKKIEIIGERKRQRLMGDFKTGFFIKSRMNIDEKGVL